VAINMGIQARSGWGGDEAIPPVGVGVCGSAGSWGTAAGKCSPDGADSWVSGGAGAERIGASLGHGLVAQWGYVDYGASGAIAAGTGGGVATGTGGGSTCGVGSRTGGMPLVRSLPKRADFSALQLT